MRLIGSAPVTPAADLDSHFGMLKRRCMTTSTVTAIEGGYRQDGGVISVAALGWCVRGKARFEGWSCAALIDAISVERGRSALPARYRQGPVHHVNTNT